MVRKIPDKDISGPETIDEDYSGKTSITLFESHNEPSGEIPALIRIDCGIRHEEQSDRVFFTDFAYIFNNIGKSRTYNICQASSDSFLITDFYEKSVAKLDTSTTGVHSVQLPGNTSHICAVDPSRAAVCIETGQFLYGIYLLDIQELRTLHSFEIKERCLGMTYKNTNLYVAGSGCISVLSLNGENQESFFHHKKDECIIQMTGGPRNTLVCVCKIASNLLWVTLDVNGHLLETLYSKSTDLSNFPPNCVMVAADMEGNTYTCYRDWFANEDKGLSKINKEGHDEVYIPEFHIKALCYDATNNMVALLSDGKLVFRTFDEHDTDNVGGVKILFSCESLEIRTL